MFLVCAKYRIQNTAVDADDVEEADHEHGEGGDNDVDWGDDQHLGRNMLSLSLSQGN